MIITGITKEQKNFEETRTKDIEKMHEYQRYVDNTDWYITRKYERGIEIPSEVSTKRMEAIEEINRIRDLYELKQEFFI